MRTKKIRDIIIACFLVSTLALAGILVSCSEKDNPLIEPGPGNTGTISYAEETSLVAKLFLSLGEGAGRQVGGQLMGWALSAMGLSAQSGPNYSHQLNKIAGDLDSMVILMNGLHNELTNITNAVNSLNCGTQLSDLDDEFGAIRELRDQYNSMLSTGQQGDTVSNEIIHDWADKVLAINNYAGATSLGTMLNTIEANLETNNGALIACMNTLSKPSAGTFGSDITYYNKVNALVTYFYYYQAFAMAMLSDAYHYYAWVNAGSPGNEYTSADSVQKICEANGTSQNDCNNVSVKMNTLYNTLLKQVTDAGAPYTSDYLLYQQIGENTAYVWIKSLENYAAAAGYNCGSHLTNSTPCNPVSGYYYSTITHDEYHYAKHFHFAGVTELRNLIDVTQVGSGMTNGQYLESNGFHNMSGKTFIAADTVMVKFDYMINDQRMAVVPFFNTDVPPSSTGHAITSVYMTEHDFQYVLPSKYEQHRNSFCGYDGNYVSRLYHYSTNSSLIAVDSWLNTYAKSRTCDDGTFVIPFEFTNHNYEGDDCCYPGFLALKQRQSSTPKRFLFPVMNPFAAGCADGRSNTNASGMPTMCHHNFTEYLNANVPKPLSCNFTYIIPACD